MNKALVGRNEKDKIWEEPGESVSGDSQGTGGKDKNRDMSLFFNVKMLLIGCSGKKRLLILVISLPFLTDN